MSKSLKSNKFRFYVHQRGEVNTRDLATYFSKEEVPHETRDWQIDQLVIDDALGYERACKSEQICHLCHLGICQFFRVDGTREYGAVFVANPPQLLIVFRFGISDSSCKFSKELVGWTKSRSRLISELDV